MRIKIVVEVGKLEKDGYYTRSIDSSTKGEVELEFDLPDKMNQPNIGDLLNETINCAIAEYKEKEAANV